MTNSLCLHVLRLEVLGLLKQQASMEQFVKEVGLLKIYVTVLYNTTLSLGREEYS